MSLTIWYNIYWDQLTVLCTKGFIAWDCDSVGSCYVISVGGAALVLKDILNN